MGDSPSLTASDSTAKAAGPSKPKQEAAISCDKFDNILYLRSVVSKSLIIVMANVVNICPV